MPSTMRNVGAGERDAPRNPHHGAREPVPEAFRGGARVGLGPALEELGGERVDPLAEEREDGGQDRQRDRRRRERDERAADAHRVEEPLREHRQRRQRARDGDRGVGHGPAGGRHRSPERLHACARLGDLLAVARDDEQAVVDREAQPEARDEVEREDRDRAQLAGDREEQERRDDREAADQKRQHRGDEAPEEEEREEEEDREGEHLRPLQVRLDVLVDLLLRDGVAADEDALLALELGDQELARLLDLVVFGRVELNRQVRRLTVLRDERVGLGVEIPGGRANALDAGDGLRDLGERAARPRASRRPRRSGRSPAARGSPPPRASPSR